MEKRAGKGTIPDCEKEAFGVFFHVVTYCLSEGEQVISKARGFTATSLSCIETSHTPMLLSRKEINSYAPHQTLK